MKSKITVIFCLLTAMLLGTGCCDRHGTEITHFDRVMVLVSAGYNNIGGYLRDDISDLCDEDGGSYVPGKGDALALLVVSHQPQTYADYSTPTPTYLIRIVKDGKVRRDTLETFDTGNKLTEPAFLSSVLCSVKERFPSDHYGMVYSSHGTGWLPEGFYGKHGSSYTFASAAPQQKRPSTTLGNEFGSDKDVEMDIKDVAGAIPMHLDYMLIDACLMGCVEVAAELRHVTDKLGFSAAEILTQGFDYHTLAANLLRDDNPLQVCRDYFKYYDAQSGQSRSATISFVDCTGIDRLAEACRTAFERNRDALASVNPSKVQGFFRFGEHWFYDLEDILVKAGVDSADLQEVRKALDACILYKAATPNFMGAFDIKTYCGMTMYLPAWGHPTLDTYYKGLEWNNLTGLIR